MACSGNNVEWTRSTRCVPTSASDSPCCVMSKNHGGRRLGTPATCFMMWCTLAAATPGSLRVPATGSPNTSGSSRKTGDGLLPRCRHVVEDESSFVGCVQRRLEHRQVLAPDD